MRGHTPVRPLGVEGHLSTRRIMKFICDGLFESHDSVTSTSTVIFSPSYMAIPARQLNYGAVVIYHEAVLGVGSFGKVCKAKCGQLSCAVKLLHETLFQDNDPGISRLVQRFEQECQFLRRIKHPNIVQFLGTIRNHQTGRLGLLTELMDESLTTFLERSTGPLLYHIQLNIAHDVALAMAYLHSNNIIHRDLSSNNVLLIGEGIQAKVTDFGTSTLIDMNPRMTQLTQCPGCIGYMPPEALITPPLYSSKLDCFSHGVLTIQIATRQFPNPGKAHRYIDNPAYPTGQILVPFPEMERRKEHIDQVEPDHPLLPLALHCLKDRDTERPSADELCARLASLKSEPMYLHSLDQSRQQNMLLRIAQQQLREKDDNLARVREELQRCREQYEEELNAKESTVEQVLADCRAALQAKTEQYDRELNSNQAVIKRLHNEIQQIHPLETTTDTEIVPVSCNKCISQVLA